MAWASRNLATRRFNLNLNQEDAFVLGYFGVHFSFSSTTADEIIKSAQVTSDKDADRRLWSNADDLAGTFSALCEAVSGVPGGTLNFVDITAMGGTKWGAAGSIDFGDQVTLRFRELSGMPLTKAIGAWANLVRHTNSGVSMLVDNEYTKTNWTADLTYWILRPNGKSVEAGIKFTGVYPMSDLGSQINTDITSVDGQTFDVNFHVDDMYWDANSTREAQSLVDQYYENGKAAYWNHTAGSLG
jgi:hypothetical protein